MTGRLTGRTIMVTGGGSGIGAELCRGFAVEGANVAVADLDGESASRVASSISGDNSHAIAVEMDVTSRAAVADGIQRTVREFGSFDAMFNNAGMNSPMKLLDVDEANFDLIMKVNVLGVLIGMQEAAKQFIVQGSGGKNCQHSLDCRSHRVSELCAVQCRQSCRDFPDAVRSEGFGRARRHGQRLCSRGGGHPAVGEAR